MKKVSIFLYMLLSLFATSITTVCAQTESRIISGVVTEQETGNPIHFVNVGIEGTFVGGASDKDGIFSFKTINNYKGYNLYVSAIGYKPIRVAWDKIVPGEILKFKLQKHVEEIVSVDITAKSLVMYRILRIVSERIKDNYTDATYSVSSYYQKSDFIGDSLIDRDESLLTISDGTGYISRDQDQAYKAISYKFDETRRLHDSVSFNDGSAQIDELLGYDIIRVKGNVLDPHFLHDYDLTDDGETIFDGERVWIIGYTLIEPTLAKTGDAHVLSYSGRIYVNKSNYAVVKNETRVSASNISPLGRGFFVSNPLDGSRVSSASYYFNTIYRSVNSRYLLAATHSERETVVIKDGVSQSHRAVSDLLVDKVNSAGVTVKGRDYYNDVPFRKSFWSNYSYSGFAELK